MIMNYSWEGFAIKQLWRGLTLPLLLKRYLVLIRLVLIYFTFKANERTPLIICEHLKPVNCSWLTDNVNYTSADECINRNGKHSPGETEENY